MDRGPTGCCITGGGGSPVPSGGSQFDVQRSDSQLFAALSHVLSRQHGGVRRRLVSVGLHLHPTGHAANGLPGNDGKMSHHSNTSEVHDHKRNNNSPTPMMLW